MTWRFVEYYYERLVKLFQIECVLCRRYIRYEEKATQYVQFNYVFRQMKLAI